ncbi:hypothetical protein AWZ03_013308 [Drosophila navojoa]|uniref:Uncharacterized protein n=1 Tax=Drosophila navojoa TaxID=7232 RepID=A0A484AUG9_DRONA|nr:hypothetical protein AWZ03_013308 [Drosophila navojoa]
MEEEQQWATETEITGTTDEPAAAADIESEGRRRTAAGTGMEWHECGTLLGCTALMHSRWHFSLPQQQKQQEQEQKQEQEQLADCLKHV